MSTESPTPHTTDSTTTLNGTTTDSSMASGNTGSTIQIHTTLAGPDSSSHAATRRDSSRRSILVGVLLGVVIIIFGIGSWILLHPQQQIIVGDVQENNAPIVIGDIYNNQVAPPSPPPLETVIPFLPSGLQWPQYISETFDTNERNWQVQQEHTDFGDVVYQFTPDHTAYQIIHTETVTGITSMADASIVIPNNSLYAAVDILKVRGPIGSTCGLVFRQHRDGLVDGLYYVRIEEENSTFSVKYQQPTGKWTTIIDQRPSDQIRPGQAHRLAIQIEGGILTVFINNRVAGTYTIEPQSVVTFPTVDLAAQLIKSGDTGICQFDNLEVRWP